MSPSIAAMVWVMTVLGAVMFYTFGLWVIDRIEGDS